MFVFTICWGKKIRSFHQILSESPEIYEALSLEMHVWITSTLLPSALYCSNSPGNTLLTIVRCLPHARSYLGHVTHPFVEFSKPPELNTGVSVQLTVHLGWSPPGFITYQYKADLAGGCWLLTADRVCPLPGQQTYKTGIFYSPHCIDEETEAQSNSLTWQITQLLIANIDSQCPTSATPWHPTHGCRIYSSKKFIWTQN